MEKRQNDGADRAGCLLDPGSGRAHASMPHLMNKRTDAEVYVNMEFDVTETLRYIEERTGERTNTRPPCSTVSSWPLPKPYTCGRI